MAEAIRSIASPICGRADFTAAATLASSALIMCAISNEDFRSRSDASAFVCLAPSWLNRDWLLRFFKSLSPEIALATQKPLAALTAELAENFAFVEDRKSGIFFASFATVLRTLRLKAFRRELSRRFLQSLNDGVMYLRTQLFNRLIVAVWPGAVCEKRYRKLALRIDPQGCPRVTEMPKRARREIFPRL